MGRGSRSTYPRSNSCVQDLIFHGLLWIILYITMVFLVIAQFVNGGKDGTVSAAISEEPFKFFANTALVIFAVTLAILALLMEITLGFLAPLGGVFALIGFIAMLITAALPNNSFDTLHDVSGGVAVFAWLLWIAGLLTRFIVFMRFGNNRKRVSISIALAVVSAMLMIPTIVVTGFAYLLSGATASIVFAVFEAIGLVLFGTIVVATDISLMSCRI